MAFGSQALVSQSPRVRNLFWQTCNVGCNWVVSHAAAGSAEVVSGPSRILPAACTAQPCCATRATTPYRRTAWRLGPDQSSSVKTISWQTCIGFSGCCAAHAALAHC